MTNRERLGKMALIDLLMELKNKGSCFISESWDNRRCEIYDKCYDCLAAWLNEESKLGDDYDD